MPAILLRTGKVRTRSRPVDRDRSRIHPKTGADGFQVGLLGGPQPKEAFVPGLSIISALEPGELGGRAAASGQRRGDGPFGFDIDPDPAVDVDGHSDPAAAVRQAEGDWRIGDRSAMGAAPHRDAVLASQSQQGAPADRGVLSVLPPVQLLDTVLLSRWQAAK